MKQKSPLVVYSTLVAFFYTQTDGFVQRDILAYCTMKSAPILMLAAIAATTSSQINDRRHRRFAWALAFGGVGDFLLSTNELGFLLGAVSFAVGHIFNIAYFGAFLQELSYGCLTSCILYAWAVNHFLIVPWFSSAPVVMVVLMTYSVVICLAVIIAGSLCINGSSDGRRGKHFRSLAIGYSLFFASDTVILLTRFNFIALPYADAIILLSYYGAQYLVFRNALNTQAAAKAISGR